MQQLFKGKELNESCETDTFSTQFVQNHVLFHHLPSVLHLLEDFKSFCAEGILFSEIKCSFTLQFAALILVFVKILCTLGNLEIKGIHQKYIKLFL